MSIEQIAYQIAYFMMPPQVFEPKSTFVNSAIAHTPKPGGTDVAERLYIVYCHRAKISPDPEIGGQFRSHKGRLDSGHNYFIIEYPRPTRSLAESMVPAPFFSGFVVSEKDNVVQYFVLGQSPMAGMATFRTITADGTNCNLGPRTKTDLSAFLDYIREHLNRD